MKHIDNLFREELGNYTEAPPPMVWDALEKRLEGDRGKRVFPYRWMLYCAVISMVLVGTGSLAWKMSNTGGETIAVEAAGVEGTTATINETKASDIKPIEEPKTIALNATNTSAKTVKHHKTKTHTAHTTKPGTVAVKKTPSHTATAAKHVEKKAIAQEADDANTSTTSTNSDYDYYAAATSGDESAPAPKAKTEVEGYIVNVRRKNNIKVADMAPVEEKVAYQKSTEVRTSAENMVVSTMPASAEAEVNHTQHAVARKTNTATVARNNSANTQDQNSVAKVQVSKPSAFASAVNKNVAKPAAANAPNKTAANNTKASAPTAVKSVQTAVTTVGAKAKAEAPVVHKVTSPAENAKAENKATVKKDIAKVPAKAIASKQPIASATATKAPAEKAVAQKEKPAATKVSNTLAGENKIPAAAQPTVKKDVATKQVAAIIPSATAGVNKAPENKVTAAKPIAERSGANKQVTAIAPSTANMANSVAKKGIDSRLAKTETVKTKEKEIAKKEVVALESTKFPVATTPTAKTKAAKAEKVTKPVIAKKEKEEKSAIAKEEKKEATKAAEEETAIAVTEKKEAQKPATKSAAKQSTTVAKQTTPAATTNTFAASNMNAAKKVFRPSIFVEDPANIRIDPFFAAAVLHNIEEAPLPGTFKEPVASKAEQLPAPAITAQPVATVDSSASKQAAWRNKITGGIKLGVEGTYNGDGAKRAVISPYLEYKMNNKMSFLFQPTLKFSNLSKRTLDGTQSYIKVNDDGKATLKSTEPWIIPTTPGNFDTLWFRQYTYTQSHDSLVNSYGIGGNSLDFDIPLMLKYNLSKKFSVYGGVNLSYHKVAIKTNTYNSGPIVVTADSFTLARSAAGTPAPPPVSAVIRYGSAATTAPQSLYSQPNGELNIGYMVGFSYEFRRRCLFDALIHQGFAKTNEVGGYNINTAFSMPYLRLTVGYRLMK